MTEPPMFEPVHDYRIAFCQEAEAAELQAFIQTDWKAGHILAAHREMLDWQHYDRRERRYNFVIARHLPTNAIHGMLGFIPTNHFDPAIPVCDLWLAIWKVRENVQCPGLGLMLLDYLVEAKQPRTISAIGLRKGVIPVFRALRYQLRMMNHYYLVNPAVSDFHLIGNFDGRYHAQAPQADSRKQFRECDSAQISALSEHFSGNPFSQNCAPAKSFAYIANRYLRHPIYTYRCFGIIEQERTVGLFVLRLLHHAGSHALRIVDYVGAPDVLRGAFPAFKNLLECYQAEYLDWYNFGLDDELMASLGFLKREPASRVVVPNYFEPFEQKNVNLDVAYYGDSVLTYIMHKGDSDQDRPNFPLQGR